MEIENKKKGQVTIFIIIAIILVAMIALFILFRSGLMPNLPFGKEVNPQAYMKSCIEDRVYDGIRELSLVGGTLNNDNSVEFTFSEEGVARKISYLCYNEEPYMKCINQQPLLINHFEEQLKDYIENDLSECYDAMIINLKNPEENYEGFELELMPEKIKIKINADIRLEKNDEIKTYEDFEIAFPSKIYELLNVAKRIVNDKSSRNILGEGTSNFDIMNYEINYPEYDIDRFPKGNGIEIYTIQFRNSDEKFRFATRGDRII